MRSTWNALATVLTASLLTVLALLSGSSAHAAVGDPTAPPAGTGACGSVYVQQSGSYSARTYGGLLLRVYNPGPGGIIGRVTVSYGAGNTTTEHVYTVAPGSYEDHAFGNVNTPYPRLFFITSNFYGLRGVQPGYSILGFSSTCHTPLS
ncbi:hypothetical protein [Lentzea sp. HUAS12]|uniref:hypothetical protein n=1 Tax=Lentzea sp. HUAS12 TaxID=2951806 RepID=UPI00209E3D79|nr:hypothetical protein [Lentzea sp. HUAS12]USX56387.1 hypothetical protein ND450_20485 [Lentzea sp. HUAS12]